MLKHIVVPYLLKSAKKAPKIIRARIYRIILGRCSKLNKVSYNFSNIFLHFKKAAQVFIMDVNYSSYDVNDYIRLVFPV